MGQWPTDQELLAAVRGAGWLLEHHAVRILAEAGAHPTVGWAFEDPDEPTKSRELDVWAYKKILALEQAKLTVSARFLVECKQSAQPYVAIGYDVPEHRHRMAPTEHVLPRKSFDVPMKGSPTRYRVVPAWTFLGLDSVTPEHRPDRFRATQLTRLDRAKAGAWTANNDGVFTSLVYPLAKALLASKAESKGDPPTGSRDGRKRIGWAAVALHFPVVLVSCPLYVVDASSPNPEVEERPWVTARRELRSRSVAGVFEIDVVTESAFADYVADRLAFARAVGDNVAADPLRVTGEDQPPG